MSKHTETALARSLAQLNDECEQLEEQNTELIVALEEIHKGAMNNIWHKNPETVIAQLATMAQDAIAKADPTTEQEGD